MSSSKPILSAGGEPDPQPKGANVKNILIDNMLKPDAINRLTQFGYNKNDVVNATNYLSGLPTKQYNSQYDLSGAFVPKNYQDEDGILEKVFGYKPFEGIHINKRDPQTMISTFGEEGRHAITQALRTVDFKGNVNKFIKEKKRKFGADDKLTNYLNSLIDPDKLKKLKQGEGGEYKKGASEYLTDPNEMVSKAHGLRMGGLEKGKKDYWGEWKESDLELIQDNPTYKQLETIMTKENILKLLNETASNNSFNYNKIFTNLT
jgi:hypothetical protein